MKISDKIKSAFKSLYNSEVRSSTSPIGQVLRNYQKEATFSPVRQLQGITFKGIDKIGTSLSIYEPIIKRKSGDIYVNHPLLTLFENPNKNQQNPSDFIHLFGMLYEIYGETFWYLVKGESSQKVKEIYLLNPAQMELIIEQGELIGYILHKASGQQVPLTLDEIYHDKRPNPFNEWRGMSVMEKAATYIDTEITTSVFTLNYMKNNASPSGIVSLPEMDKETFKMFAAQWREGYEGPENAGKTAFIRGGQADFKAVGATLKDVDQEITRKMAKNDVLMMLEVPKEILGMTDGGALGRNTVEAFGYMYNKEKIEPIMRRLDRIYENIWNRQNGVGEQINVTHESPVPEDKEYEHMLHKDLVNIALTVNEVREELGYAPIEGGDDLPTTTGTIAPMESTEDPSNANKIKIVSFKQKKSKGQAAKELNAKQEEFRAKLVATNDIYMLKVKKVISNFARKQGQAVISKINGSSKAYDEWLFNIKEESIVLAEAMTPVMLELMNAQIEDTANFITGELITLSADVRKTVDVSLNQISGLFNVDTVKALEKTLSEGQAAGESLVSLKKRVESVYSDAKGYRAERIARTESLKASNLSAQDVYFQNGYSEVEWFINPGACEFCKNYAGQTKSIGSVFNKVGDVITLDSGSTMRIEYADIGTPPLHPNCTCSIVPSGKPASA